MLNKPDERIWKHLVAVRSLDVFVGWLAASRAQTLEAMAVQQDESKWRVLQGSAATLKELLDYIEASRKMVEQLTHNS